MKFWQLMILSLVAMAALAHAEEGTEDAGAVKPVEDAVPEPEADAEPEVKAEPEIEEVAEAEGEPETSPEPEGEPEDAVVEPEGTAADDEVDEDVQAEEVEEEVEEDGDVVKEKEIVPVEMEGVVESSKTAAQESDNDSGATSVCFSFSTVILSTLAALKFAH